MFVCPSGGVLVSSHAPVSTHTSTRLFGTFGAHATSMLKSASDLYFILFFYVSQHHPPTMIANDTQRITLEATNVPVSKLTRSATHVSNNQATFQPLDSGDPSTLLSRSLSASSLLLLSTACSSERSEQLTETLYHKTPWFHSHHSIKVR